MSLGPVTSALVRGLSTQVLAGDGIRPAGGGWQGAVGESPFVGYCIVYPLPATFSGPASDDHADESGTWQITSVGANREQAQDIADLTRAWMLDHADDLDLVGRVVAAVAHDGGGAVRRDETTPPVFYGTDRYLVITTPT